MDSINTRVLVVAAFAAVLTGCKSEPPLAPLERAAKIDAATTVNFSGVVGTSTTPAPAVRVTDKDGEPVADVQVAFNVTGGNGFVTPARVTTDANGRASTEWTLGTALAANTLKATVGALAPVVFNAMAVAGPPVALERAGVENQLAVAGTVAASPLKARVFDAFHNPVAGVSVAFSVTSGGGTVSPSNPVTDGTGSVSAVWTLGTTEGVQTAKAQWGALSVVFTADTFRCPGDAAFCTGLIFVRLDNQIYRTSVDGTEPSRLTNEGSNSAPASSPDGKQIAFIRYAPFSGGPGTSDVYTMDANGSNPVRRTSGGFYYSVTWSPDGRKLAVDGPTGGDSLNISIISLDVDGGAPKVIIGNGGAPAWSPDGNLIAYARGTGYYDASQIYVMNADGTNRHRATPDSVGYNWSPAWSPNGQKISFMRCISTCGIYTMNADGTAMTRVAEGYEPAWSPDGKWLALSTFSSNSQSIDYVAATGGLPRSIVSNGRSPSWLGVAAVGHQRASPTPGR